MLRHKRLWLVCAWVLGWLATSQCPALADGWLKAESPHFIVYSNVTEQATRDYVSKLEAFNKTAGSFYRQLSNSEIVSQRKPVFYYIREFTEYKTVNNRVPENTLPTYPSCKDGSAFFYTLDKMVDDDTNTAMKFSNLNTFLSNNYDTSQLPEWLSTGLFLYLATADIKEDTVILGTPSRFQFLYYDYYSGEQRSLMGKADRIPFSEIISGKYTNPKKKGSIRGQSWIVVHYLMSDQNNISKLYKYSALVSHGEDSLEAFKSTIGVDPAIFDDIVTQYKTKGVPLVTYKYAPTPATDVNLTALPDYSEPVPLLSAAMRTCPYSEHKKNVLARLEKVADENPTDAYAQRERARARVLFGDSTQALPYLASEVLKDPKDYDAQYLIGRHYLKLAQSGGPDSASNYGLARTELGKAYKLNQTWAPTLYYFAKAHANLDGYPSDNVLAAVETARDLINDSDYIIYLAELYVRRGMYDEAQTLLADFSFNPKGKTNYDLTTAQIVAAIKDKRPMAEIVKLFELYSEHVWDK